MDFEKLHDVTYIEPTNRQELLSHFVKKVSFFIEENDFNDGPTLEDLLDEMLSCFQQLDTPKNTLSIFTYLGLGAYRVTSIIVGADSEENALALINARLKAKNLPLACLKNLKKTTLINPVVIQEELDN